MFDLRFVLESEPEAWAKETAAAPPLTDATACDFSARIHGQLLGCGQNRLILKFFQANIFELNGHRHAGVKLKGQNTFFRGQFRAIVGKVDDQLAV